MFHSIGIRSSALLAWYHVSAMTATPPLNTRPRHSAGSGIGNCTAERTPGIVRIAFEVVALDVAAVDGARLHGRPFHAGDADVDPVHRLPGHLLRHVEVLLLGAHQRPLVRRLDGDRFRMRMRRRGGTLRDPAVRRGAAARRVRDDAVLRRQLGDGHAPEVRRGEQQTLARFGSRELQVIAAVFDRGRGVRPHASIQAVGNARDASTVAIAEPGFAAAFRIGRALAHDVERPRRRLLACIAIRGRVLRADLRPVALQLLADHHRVARSRHPGRARSGRCGSSRCHRARRRSTR